MSEFETSITCNVITVQPNQTVNVLERKITFLYLTLSVDFCVPLSLRQRELK